MNIQRDNYEEWLVQSLEGELTEEENAQLEDFLKKNPDLMEDAALLAITKLEPDTHIVFAHKEALKKPEGGRVLVLSTAFKWASAAAAVLLIVSGVSFWNQQNSGSSAIATQYQNKTTTIQLPSKSVDTGILMNPVETPIENAVAENQIKPRQKSPDLKVMPLESIDRESWVANTLQKKEVEQLPAENIRPKLKVPDFEEQYARIYGYHFDQMMKGVQPEKTQPYTLVDKWNDALATADDVNQMFQKVRKHVSNEDLHNDVKTTSIKLFGIEYYNRKRIN